MQTVVRCWGIESVVSEGLEIDEEAIRVGARVEG